jgi:hypothetical protein
MSDSSKLGDDYDDPLERSPLERDITRDGVTVRLFIYRGREEAGWILEIEASRARLSAAGGGRACPR